MNRLVLAWLVARASASAPSSSRSPPSWRSWRPPWVQLKTPQFASSCPPAAGARSEQPRFSPCRWVPCPRLPDPGAASTHRPAGPAARHYVQNGQTGGTEVGRQGCWKEKCRQALCSRLLLLPLLVVVPASRWTSPEWCHRSCFSKSFMIKFILKSAASLSSMTPETRSESRCGPQAS